jgi:hypothetical protein
MDEAMTVGAGDVGEMRCHNCGYAFVGCDVAGAATCPGCEVLRLREKLAASEARAVDLVDVNRGLADYEEAYRESEREREHLSDALERKGADLAAAAGALQGCDCFLDTLRRWTTKEALWEWLLHVEATNKAFSPKTIHDAALAVLARPGVQAAKGGAR